MSNMKEEKTEGVGSWKIQMHEMKDPINYEKCHIYKIVDLGYTCMDCSDAEMKLLVAPRKYLHAPTVKSMPQ